MPHIVVLSILNVTTPVARDALVEAVEAGPGGPRIELAGPQPHRADQMAAAYADAIGHKVRVIPMPFPSRAFREGAMLPGPAVRVDERCFEDGFGTTRWPSDASPEAGRPRVGG